MFINNQTQFKGRVRPGNASKRIRFQDNRPNKPNNGRELDERALRDGIKAFLTRELPDDLFTSKPSTESLYKFKDIDHYAAVSLRKQFMTYRYGQEQAQALPVKPQDYWYFVALLKKPMLADSKSGKWHSSKSIVLDTADKMDMSWLFAKPKSPSPSLSPQPELPVVSPSSASQSMILDTPSPPLSVHSPRMSPRNLQTSSLQLSGRPETVSPKLELHSPIPVKPNASFSPVPLQPSSSSVQHVDVEMEQAVLQVDSPQVSPRIFHSPMNLSFERKTSPTSPRSRSPKKDHALERRLSFDKKSPEPSHSPIKKEKKSPFFKEGSANSPALKSSLSEPPNATKPVKTEESQTSSTQQSPFSQNSLFKDNVTAKPESSNSLSSIIPSASTAASMEPPGEIDSHVRRHRIERPKTPTDLTASGERNKYITDSTVYWERMQNSLGPIEKPRQSQILRVVTGQAASRGMDLNVFQKRFLGNPILQQALERDYLYHKMNRDDQRYFNDLNKGDGEIKFKRKSAELIHSEFIQRYIDIMGKNRVDSLLGKERVSQILSLAGSDRLTLIQQQSSLLGSEADTQHAQTREARFPQRSAGHGRRGNHRPHRNGSDNFAYPQHPSHSRPYRGRGQNFNSHFNQASRGQFNSRPYRSRGNFNARAHSANRGRLNSSSAPSSAQNLNSAHSQNLSNSETSK